MKKIRVCHVITRMIRGGAQKIVMTLLERLDRGRFDPILVTGAQSGTEGTFLHEIERLAVPVHVVPELVREIRPGRDVKVAMRLVRMFHDLKPDIVHAHTYKAGIIGNIAARCAGIRGIVFTPHGHIFEPHARIPGVPENRVKLAALYWITRLSQECADSITALSDKDMQDQVRLSLARSSKYRVIRNGIDVPNGSGGHGHDTAYFRKHWHVHDAQPVIGAVGRLTSEKGHQYLVEAMRDIGKAYPKAKLLIVGNGPLMGDLNRRVDDLGLRESVMFLGQLDDIRKFLSIIDIFVQPSLYESQGLAIMEAMAMRKPVVATAVGGVTDVVQDGVTGLLAPPRDPRRLADGVDRLLRDRDLSDQMVRNAHERIMTEYSVERMVRDYESLYLETLGLTGRNRSWRKR